MSADGSTEMQRLLETLGRRLPGGPRHGWKQRIAERIGVSPGHLSRLISGERRASASLMEKVHAVAAEHAASGGGDVAAAVAALLALDPATRRKVIAFVEDLDGDGANA